MPNLPSIAIRSPNWLPFEQNQSTECKDHNDTTGPDDTCPDVFDALPDTPGVDLDPNNPIANLPDLLISATTNVETEEQHNGTSATTSDGPAFSLHPQY